MGVVLKTKVPKLRARSALLREALGTWDHAGRQTALLMPCALTHVCVRELLGMRVRVQAWAVRARVCARVCCLGRARAHPSVETGLRSRARGLNPGSAPPTCILGRAGYSLRGAVWRAVSELLSEAPPAQGGSPPAVSSHVPSVPTPVSWAPAVPSGPRPRFPTAHISCVTAAGRKNVPAS